MVKPEEIANELAFNRVDLHTVEARRDLLRLKNGHRINGKFVNLDMLS